MFDRYISFAARQAPDVIAVSDGINHVSYGALDQAINGMVGRLSAALGEQIASTVGICVSDSYRHALLILACARLGLPSASLFPQVAASLATLVGAGVIVTDDATLRGGGVPVIVADPSCFTGGAPTDAAAICRTIDPTGLARVQLSSGTTGQPKAVELTWATLDTRVANGFLGNGDGTKRVLTLIGLESGGLQSMLTAWKHRGCVLLGPGNAAALAAALPVLAPTGMLASPVQLAALLDALPAEAPPFAGIELAVGGGKVSKALADRAAVRLGARVSVVYASTEAGTVAVGYGATLSSDGAAGFVTPSSQVEIVDDAGRLLPAGEVGEVRISGREVASGYRGENSELFADGWFWPGDLGSIDTRGLLRIIGRKDEIMNLGGEKFLPEDLEDKVRPVDGVADVAAFSVDDAAGNAQPWLAVVRDGDIAEGAIGRALTLPGLPPVHVAWIDAIPRTAMGKVRRDELRKAAAALDSRL